MSLPDSVRRPGRPKGLDSACREKLLAAALPAFARRGFDGVSLREIATRSGFDVSMIAHHFGSKAKLWFAVVDAIALEDDLTRFRTIIASDLPLPVRLSRVLDRFIDHLADRPEVVMFLAREVSTPGERLDFLVERAVRPTYEVLEPLWREAMNARIVEPINPAVFHMGLIGAFSTVLSARAIVGRLSGQTLALTGLKDEMRRGLLRGLLVDDRGGC